MNLFETLELKILFLNVDKLINKWKCNGQKRLKFLISSERNQKFIDLCASYKLSY